ncbi:hypothetical protein E1B28_007144 [Marasmius oreades]|uniref:Uncharacterized protein n=1 Tax=Marasmius oreades TaxID=181124 RepID=A0A9P7UTH2_9AGAR|nr:uncharacterized protein E1B28_007144 [Marasmius oreades]KAG7093468.1 hypothetical protein E1B28_007144 [Marasmius oreades]
MSKRKLVPKAQHAEYTQYASLLRSLRTNNILDVTSQLTQYQAELEGKQRVWADEDEDDEYGDGSDYSKDLDDEHESGSQKARNSHLKEDLNLMVAGPSNLHTSSLSPSSRQTTPRLKRKSIHGSISREGSLSSLRETSSTISAPSRRKKKQRNQFSQIRDGWTRWPLMLEDVPVPDWGMEDEVENLVNLLRTSTREDRNPSTQKPEVSEEPQSVDWEVELPPSSLPSSSQTLQTYDDALDEGNQGTYDVDDEELDSDLDSLDSLDPPSFLRELTLTATNLLHTTLAALAHFTPARAPSLQNRLEPIGWGTVLDAFAFGSLNSGVGASHIQTNQKIAENVRKRIEIVYGSGASRPSTGHRLDEIPPDIRVISMPPAVLQTEVDVEQIECHEQSPSQSIEQPQESRSVDLEGSFLLFHRLQVIMNSRQRLAESFEKYGASESSLFDTRGLRMETNENKNSGTSKRSTRSAAARQAPSGPSTVSAVASRGSGSMRRASTRRPTNFKGKGNKIKAKNLTIDAERKGEEEKSRGVGL